MSAITSSSIACYWAGAEVGDLRKFVGGNSEVILKLKSIGRGRVAGSVKEDFKLGAQLLGGAARRQGWAMRLGALTVHRISLPRSAAEETLQVSLVSGYLVPAGFT